MDENFDEAFMQRRNNFHVPIVSKDLRTLNWRDEARQVIYVVARFSALWRSHTTFITT